MLKVNCGVVRCSSGTYGINKWKKEPYLEHGDKNIVEWQCPNCERPYSLYCFPVEMKKGKKRDMDLNERIQTEQQKEPQKTVIQFVHSIF